MQFKVRFVHGSKHVVYKKGRTLGLRDVDRIRHELGVPELSLERIDNNVWTYYKYEVAVPLTEEQARQANGGFLCSDTVRVQVPERSLTKYVIECIRSEKNKETGEIEKVWIEYNVDRNTLLNDWLAAGAPEEWDPSDEDLCRPLEDDEIEECY